MHDSRTVYKQCMYCLYTVYVRFTYCLWDLQSFYSKKILKIGHIALFTRLKIILL